MGRKKKRINYAEKLKRLRLAGLKGLTHRPMAEIPEESLGDLSGRVDHILKFLSRAQKQDPRSMFCMIMYDITDNKIRHYIAKYLLQQGCQRVQKSVYLGRLDRKKIKAVHKTLAEVNDMYDNEDSIIILPLGDEQIEKWKMIGKNVDVTLVIDRPNTLFI